LPDVRRVGALCDAAVWTHQSRAAALFFRKLPIDRVPDPGTPWPGEVAGEPGGDAAAIEAARPLAEEANRQVRALKLF
jgi:hypothetical protein